METKVKNINGVDFNSTETINALQKMYIGYLESQENEPANEKVSETFKLLCQVFED